MADDLLKELLTSPLEKPSRRRRRTGAARGDAEPGRGPSGTTITPEGSGEQGEREDVPRIPLLWALGTAVLGAAIVISAYAVASEDAVPATTTVTATTVAAVVDDGSPAGLPAGYTEIGDRLGMRVERILSRPDGVFVTVTTVVVNSLDPDGTTGYQGGLWSLILADGRRITSTAEAFDPLARGTVTVQFQTAGYTPQEITAIELNGVARRTTTTLDVGSDGAVALPDDGSSVSLALDPTRHPLDAGVFLVTEVVEMSTTGATLEWSLDGDELATAAVTPISLVVTEDGIGGAAMFGTFQTSGFTFFHPSIPGPVLGPAGEVGFALDEGTGLPSGVEFGAGIDLEVTWAVYDPVVVTLPVDGVPISELTG